MKTKFFVLLGTLAMLVLFGTVWTPQASAQAVYGSIFGTITDPSGAAVAGAKVTVTSASQGYDGRDDDQHRRQLQRHPPDPRRLQHPSGRHRVQGV